MGRHRSWGPPRISIGSPLIFINDITYVVRHCKIRLFADNTCLYIEVDDPETQAIELNEDLASLDTWAKQWHVDFSPPKTEELIISTKRDPPVHPPSELDGVVVKRVPHHKHLGLTLSKDLTWNKLTSQIRPLSD